MLTTTVLLWMVVVSAFAQTGKTCANPIPLGKNYSATITQAGTVWYVANTFDLPLTVRFYPSKVSDQLPEVQMDFACTPGVYEDSIICALFCYDQGGYLMLPHTATLTTKTENGQTYYEVSMGEFYRDMLLRAGISYNVQVYVKVTYYGKGTINLTPDVEFSQCMETDKWLLLGVPQSVAPNDEETYFIAPYSNWSTDSIRYIWEGESPATVVLGTTCSFEPMNALDAQRVDVWTMAAGGDTLNHTNAEIQYYMTYMNNPTNKAKGGVFYVKVVSEGAGTLKVERMPVPPPEGGAIEMHYNQPTPIHRNDTNTLYAISTAWTEDTRFIVPTDYIVRMYVGLSADFTPATAVDSFRFSSTEAGRELLWNKARLETLKSMTSGRFLYIRFLCNTETSVTPQYWTPSVCYDKTEALTASTITLQNRSNKVYRIRYNDWKGGDITFSWNKNSDCPFYIGDTCVVPTNASSIHVIYNSVIPKSSSVTIPAVDIAKWVRHVDPDGYLYIRFYPSAKGDVTVSSSRPEETDPQPDIHPHATIAVLCSTETGMEGERQYIVSVSQAQQMSLYGEETTASTGTPIQSWFQEPANQHLLSLQPGKYTLCGAKESILIMVE